MRDVVQEYKVLNLLNQTTAATVTGSAVDVEQYNDDALIVATVGAVIGTPTITISVTGSLTATPTTYDQTIGTFTAATAAGVGAINANLAGIKNIKGVATLSGSTSASVVVNVLTQAFAKATGLNSATLA